MKKICCFFFVVVCTLELAKAAAGVNVAKQWDECGSFSYAGRLNSDSAIIWMSTKEKESVWVEWGRIDHVSNCHETCRRCFWLGWLSCYRINSIFFKKGGNTHSKVFQKGPTKEKNMWNSCQLLLLTDANEVFLNIMTTMRWWWDELASRTYEKTEKTFR